MEDATTMKTAPITRDRYEREDYYRAQVQLHEKLVWALCYNSVFDKDSAEAGRLRDALAEAIERVTIEHFRTLLGRQEWRWYFSEWCNKQVQPDMQDAASAFLKKHFKEFFS